MSWINAARCFSQKICLIFVRNVVQYLVGCTTTTYLRGNYDVEIGTQFSIKVALSGCRGTTVAMYH